MPILTYDIPEGYITGLGRDYPHPKISHLYKGNYANAGLPMCKRGWNRDDGEAYSIWRGQMGENGICKVCLRRARAGLDGVAANIPAEQTEPPAPDRAGGEREFMSITPENIASLKPHEIFVFGSNLAGIHGAGAAKDALRWGAVFREGCGPNGQTYAIPTKDLRIQTLPLHDIFRHVYEFLEYARNHQELHFLVTAVGCGRAGYTAEQIAPMFANPPTNISLPASFWKVLETQP